MIQIDKTITSLEVLEEHFICDLAQCKGECCIQGDSGAPLSSEELTLLQKYYPIIKEYMRPDGIESIETNGVYVVDTDGEYVTPLVNQHECAYVVFDQSHTALCAIEQAWAAKRIDFQKPISCHLYPIRITEYDAFDAINYHEWNICNAACALGRKEKVPIFEFLREPLIRKYGSEWYEKLSYAAQNYQNK